MVAFTRQTSKTIGERDRWQCQGLSGVCVTANVLELPFMARKKDGFMLTAAHYPFVHHLTGRGFHDTNPRNGRMLCVICHAIEELERDNKWGANKLLSMGVYLIDHARENRQWYPTLEDIELYQDMYRHKEAV